MAAPIRRRLGLLVLSALLAPVPVHAQRATLEETARSISGFFKSLENRARALQAERVPSEPTVSDSARMGWRLRTVDRATAELLQFPDEYTGMIVESLTDDGVASLAGIDRNDVILYLDDQPLSPQVIAQAQRALDRGVPVKAVVFRKGRVYTATLAVQATGK